MNAPESFTRSRTDDAVQRPRRPLHTPDTYPTRQNQSSFTYSSGEQICKVVADRLRQCLYNGEHIDCIEKATATDDRVTMYRLKVNLENVLSATAEQLKDYCCYLYLLEPNRTTPETSLSNISWMTTVYGEYRHKSISLRHTPIWGIEHQVGQESNTQDRRDLELRHLKVPSRFTIAPGRVVKLAAGNFFSLRSSEDACVLHLMLRNSKSHVIWGGKNDAPPETQGCLKFDKVSEPEQASILRRLMDGVREDQGPVPRTEINLLSSHMDLKKREFADVLRECRNRKIPELLPSDAEYIRQVGDALCLYIVKGGHLDAESLEIERIINYIGYGDQREEKQVMVRIHWIPRSEGYPYSMRIHFFQDVTETVPHNHNSSVASMVLAGSYQHSTFQVVSSGDTYASLSCRELRNGNLTDVRRLAGVKLQELNTHTHSGRNVYYLGQESIHRVTAGDDCKAVTIFVKDNLPARTSQLFTESDDALPAEVEHRPVTAVEDKRVILNEVENLIKSANSSLQPNGHS